MSIETGQAEINQALASFLPAGVLSETRIAILNYDALLCFDAGTASEYSVVALLTETQEQQLTSTGQFKALTVVSVGANSPLIKNSLIAEILNETLFFLRLDPSTESYFSKALIPYKQNIYLASQTTEPKQSEILARVKFDRKDVIYPSTLFKWMTPIDCAKVFSHLYLEILSHSHSTPVSFNIDCESLLSHAGFNTILNTLNKTRIPNGLVLELTESEIFTHKSENAQLKERLLLLKQKGVRFSLDDFGKRQSNYDRLHEFMGLFCQVKIDRKLFSNLTKSNNLNTSVQRLLHLVSALPHEIQEVVIEGIENEHQLTIAKKLQDQILQMHSGLCVLVQGFYLDRPSPISYAIEKEGVATA